jgi:hypothetical protein
MLAQHGKTNLNPFCIMLNRLNRPVKGPIVSEFRAIKPFSLLIFLAIFVLDLIAAGLNPGQSRFLTARQVSENLDQLYSESDVKLN